MKKITKLLLVMIILSVLIQSLDAFSDYNGYSTLEKCEEDFQSSLSDGKRVMICQGDGMIFEAWLTGDNEVHVVCIAENYTLFSTKYKVEYSQACYIDEALNYYEQTGEAYWIGSGYENLHTSDTFSWCIVDNDAEGLSDRYATISYDGGACRLFYKTKYD